MIEKSYEFENGANLKPGYVKVTTLWLLETDKFIGEINVRPEFNSALLRYGGSAEMLAK